MSYELEIISQGKRHEGDIYRTFNIDNEDIIGVKKREAFEIKFRNNTLQRVQVRLSVDGTDILTGELASTKPSGKMWLVEPNEVMRLQAWPEDSKGGSRFVFSSEESSVAVNTHGNRAGIGLIAAAVYVEKPSEYVFSGSNIFVSPVGAQPIFTSFDSTGKFTRFLPVDAPMPVAGGIEQVFDNKLDSTGKFTRSLAVGAGERVEQVLDNKKGLHSPVLDDIVQVRYLPWEKLQKLLVAKPGTNAFPGDEPTRHIDLSNVPKTKPAGRRNKRSRERFSTEQRFI